MVFVHSNIYMCILYVYIFMMIGGWENWSSNTINCSVERCSKYDDYATIANNDETTKYPKC